MSKYFISLCLTCLICLPLYAPMQPDKPVSMKFYDVVEGTPWQRSRALAGFLKWPEHFGHEPQEILDIVDKETEGRFHMTAWNKETEARGGMQVRDSATRDIAPPKGMSFYRRVDVSSNEHILVLKKKLVWDPYWNFYIGCSYYKRCKQMAKRTGPQTAGGFTFPVERMQKIYYNAGIGTWRRTIKGVLDYSM